MTDRTSQALALRGWLADEEHGLVQSIVSSVNYGVLVTDLDHISLACNRRFGEIFGIDIQQVVQNDVMAVRGMVRRRIADYEGWSRNIARVHEDPECEQSDELQLVDPSCSLRRFTGPVRDSAGNVIARLWTFQDNTAEKRLERMREVLHEATLAYDPDPKRVYELVTRKVSNHYNSLAVLSIREGSSMEFRAIAGLPPGMDMGSGNSLSDSYCQFCIAREQPVVIQDARLDPEAANILPARFGITRYAGVPLRTPSGAVIGTFCILDSNSDQVLDEEDVRFLSLMAMRISGELERERQLSGLKRDLAATQNQLIQSEKLAVTGTLAASVAHDIRNILSAISLTISMGQADPTATLNDLKAHLDRFQVLSHLLLGYARPKEVALEEVSVQEVVRRVLDLLGSHFKVASVCREVRIDPSLPPILADSSRLDHVFVNLILNGIQASSAGDTIRIEALQDDRRVLVRIRDEGHGIPEDLRERLFEPFSTRRARGFGLGLFSCRQIVTECGGTIVVESKEGVGTTFSVEFPIP